MKRLILIVGGVAAVAVAILTYLLHSTHDTLVRERNARATAPARAAKLAKLYEAKAAEREVAETINNQPDEKEQVG